MSKKPSQKTTSLLKRLVEALVISSVSSYFVSQIAPTCVLPQVESSNHKAQVEFEKEFISK
ncbi:MAG: hypothetical protein F6K54_35175 [Okeania sp. SIO3B5]|uniref:hypothetical protein n=1 Tax=Okeania sp. SIO3B5 TaxID=2607811 RepID=UPI001400D9C4|nr:hypothetical protein [Okeania sp. SIO3B5]NEO57839.1 hypothetical protein [Okeania sp. SIO3B5]